MELIIGIIVGMICTYWGVSLFNKKNKSERLEQQSVVMIEKIKSVCKLISVEGDFAEIYHYEDSKSNLFGLLTGKKKAILLVNAKVHVGFDLSLLKLTANSKTKEIALSYFPDPQLLTVETDVRYYDTKDGIFNKFKAEDLTILNKEAKQFIVDKIPESGLIESAKKEAFDTILMIEQLLETSGWKLNYDALVLDATKKRHD